jgi:hypothetical protein
VSARVHRHALGMETVEQIEQRLAALVLRRQQLRELGAEANVLEPNRLAIVAAQWALAGALIGRHLRAVA